MQSCVEDGVLHEDNAYSNKSQRQSHGLPSSLYREELLLRSLFCAKSHLKQLQNRIDVFLQLSSQTFHFRRMSRLALWLLRRWKDICRWTCHERMCKYICDIYKYIWSQYNTQYLFVMPSPGGALPYQEQWCPWYPLGVKEVVVLLSQGLQYLLGY